MKQIKSGVNIFLFSILFTVAPIATYAQYFVDSLNNRLQTAKTDTSKFYSLCDLAFYYAFAYIDSSRYYTKLATDLAEKMGFDYGVFYAYHGLFYSFITQGNYPKAIEIALSNLVRAERLSFQKKLAFAIAYFDLAAAYRIMQNYQVGMDYSRLSVDYFTSVPNGDHQFFGDAIGQIGLIKLRTTNQRDSVLFYLLKGLDETLKGGLNAGTVLGAAYVGDAYTWYRQFDKALDYYFPALYRARRSDNKYLQARLLNNLSTIKLLQGNFDSCIAYAYASLSISQKFHFDNYAMDTYRTLGNVYESQHRIDSALKYSKLTLSLRDSIFSQTRIQQFDLFDFNEKKRKQDIVDAEAAYKSRLRIYGLLVGFGILLLLSIILYRSNLQRRKSNKLLSEQKSNLESTLDKLKSTQSQLIQAEKMASLGELTAGIAHEIQNPLNFVNNFSEVNKELLIEMKAGIDKGNLEEVKAIANDVIENQEKINHHGKRADAIVKGMLQHSMETKGQKEPTDINGLANEYLRLSYQGLRAKDKEFNAALQTNFDQTIGIINIIPQDIGRVLLNLYNNAFYAVSEKKKHQPDGYEPTVSLSTTRVDGKVEISVRDNGNGIPQKVVDKIFQPFFTTKPTGQGTGLGLSLSYDIIKAHGGELKVDTIEGEFAEFVIQLPVSV